MLSQGNTVPAKLGALAKTHQSPSAQTVPHITSPTKQIDAQHKAKPAWSVKRETILLAQPLVRGGGGNTVKALEADDNPTPYSYDTISHLEVVDMDHITATKLDNTVKREVNNTEIQFYVDSGCQKTIIPQSQYTVRLGPMQQTKTKFRPYGTPDYLATLGEIPVCLKTNNGAVHSTTIYVQ